MLEETANDNKYIDVLDRALKKPGIKMKWVILMNGEFGSLSINVE